MTEAVEHRRFTNDTKKYVIASYAQTQQSAKILAITLLGICALSVTATVSRLDPAEAVYHAGLAAGGVGFVMVLAWGATRNYGSLCTSHAHVADEATQEVEERIDALEAKIDARLDQLDERFKLVSAQLHAVVEADRETIAALRDAVSSSRNELDLRRGTRG